jgi:hypothetical protein
MGKKYGRKEADEGINGIKEREEPGGKGNDLRWRQRKKGRRNGRQK